MSKPGMGVMIGYLGGNKETVDAHVAANGKTIASAEIDNAGDGALVLRFTDGNGLRAYDAGRSCCESRYITCDDDLTKLVGEVFTGLETKPGPDVTVDYEVHETMFVEVQTASGVTATLTTHNEHNGYYGGFWLEVRAVAAPQEDARG